MFDAVGSPYRVPFDGSFRLKDAPTRPLDDKSTKQDRKQALVVEIEALQGLQDRLYAQNNIALLLVFQAMDAAGKDGTIRAVMSGVNPAGCQVYSFKRPSEEELDHDFLWRTARRLPERGRIGIFNRSYYEEVLIARVHPELLDHQRLPWRPERLKDVWTERLESIAAHEQHLARSGTVIVKFWLNVSEKEQKERLLARLDDPDRHWKFSAQDIDERLLWDKYMDAYEAALRATSRPWAPWYAVPADSKSSMRLIVADIVRRTLERINPQYPTVSDEEVAILTRLRERLV
jgi:PPK2 family polyphosphate:nucleotide phosphotransferase